MKGKSLNSKYVTHLLQSLMKSGKEKEAKIIADYIESETKKINELIYEERQNTLKKLHEHETVCGERATEECKSFLTEIKQNQEMINKHQLKIKDIENSVAIVKKRYQDQLNEYANNKLEKFESWALDITKKKREEIEKRIKGEAQ